MSKRINEDELLDNLVKSNEASPTDKALYLVNGVLVSLCPIFFLLVAIVCGGLLSRAYEIVANSTHTSLVRSRRLGSELDAQLSNSSAKNQKQKQAKEAAQAGQRELVHQEALSFSVLYNNALFLALVILFAFYLFKSVPGIFNFILSNGLAAVVVMLSSSSK